MSSIAMRSMLENSNHEDDLAKDLGDLLREQRGYDADREEELNIYRSGSAPPTVQGSLSAVEGILAETTPVVRFHKGGGGGINSFVTDEELRSDPSYISYYYSNVNLNPRLPPPLLSREEVRFAQRFQSRGGSGSVLGEIGDRGKSNVIGDDGSGRNSSSAFSAQKGENGAESRKSAEWGGDGLIGLPGLGLGSRQKSLAEIIQDDLSLSKTVSRTPSSNTFDDEVETSERQFSLLHQQLGASVDVQTQGFGSSSAHSSYASALGSSLPRTTTPEQITPARSPSPLIGAERIKKCNNIVPSDSADVAAALSGLTVLTGEENCMRSKYHHEPFNQNSFVPNHIKRAAVGLNNSCLQSRPVNGSYFSMDGQLDLPNKHTGMSSNLFSNGGSSPSHYHNIGVTNSSFSNHALSGYGMNHSSPCNRNLPPLFENAAASAMAVSGMDPRVFGGNIGFGAGNHHAMDPSYFQYLQGGGGELTNIEREYMASLYMDLVHNSQFANLNHNYYGNNDPYPCSPLGTHFPQNSPFGSNNNSPLSHHDRNLRFSSGMRTLMGSSWGLKSGSVCFDENFASSLLNEFKSNKTRSFELFEISGHVVDFSVDQYGSRFIQQKLENATTDERDMVFHEIMPQGLSLMTDVFGNYVVQKFFDHGSASQLRELADLLTGHVLTLSLQMYGCRVIQKAIEVVEVEQQIRMVSELDGHIMRCVRDQNGNHVIQKCIECVPESSIHFIISTFYDQILPLSTHPYGCRVIQRVLEHCSDPTTLDIVMNEILDSVCMLAQDQYGNYVIQHVLEHGKREERSVIIKKLSGQIVQMSQQKFASNVVEKCLSFGNPIERLALVNEMLGSSDENEPLQAMMKDQFANYVVQKVLETCDDNQLELILNRIKLHLNALKKYTYGKHIVARVEKLVAAGEKRINVLCPNPTP